MRRGEGLLFSHAIANKVLHMCQHGGEEKEMAFKVSALYLAPKCVPCDITGMNYVDQARMFVIDRVACTDASAFQTKTAPWSTSQACSTSRARDGLGAFRRRECEHTQPST